MALRSVVWPSFYQDSIALMRVAEALKELPRVREAAALMGTPANHELLASAGLATPESKRAGVGDLILAVEAESEGAAEAALEAAKDLFAARRHELEQAVRVLPRTLDSALAHLPNANLVAISVPGPYAKFEAARALRRGLHVFLFSDNVPLADEVELKRLAVSRRLLCMGPDCGTAYLGGVGLGFANVVPRGRVGCVAASGTGLQAVVSHVAALEEGISHGIGVGGRDLSAEVGGVMTGLALEALAADSETLVVVLISKPPAPSVLGPLEAALAEVGKPVVACCLGEPPRLGGPVRWVTTLEDAAEAAVATRRGMPWTPRAFSDPRAIGARLARVRAETDRRGAGVFGLFTGGTLAHEARLLLEPLVGPVASNLGPGGEGSGHWILDLGADEFTVGRPHPMLDPEARAARVREAGRSAAIGVVLVDLVLGRAAHPNPAGPIAAAIRDARVRAAADGRSLVVVASVVGTAGDPQGLSRQIAALEAADADVLPSNAQAARFAALVVRPDLAPSLLGESP
ncbi:MAG: acyl-CoA synthetase FdrA [Candidatus Rokubacteria bacterium]|nr:acyl-CoA synthetase FdrA [Candidatus Rokubacteria bacterium]